MARDVTLLHDPFEEKVWLTLLGTKQRGYKAVPYYTRRTPWEQARLWRQSRTAEQIKAAIRKLELRGAPFLADVLEVVGDQGMKPRVTGALPGLSWHNHSQAVDCYIAVQGRAVWAGNHPGYVAYREAALAAGCALGPSWDSAHIQAHSGRVLDRFTWAELDATMRRYFGEQEG